jgi:hypothetical protein
MQTNYMSLLYMLLLTLRVSGHRPRTHGQTTALREPNGSINKQPRTPLTMGQ